MWGSGFRFVRSVKLSTVSSGCQSPLKRATGDFGTVAGGVSVTAWDVFGGLRILRV